LWVCPALLPADRRRETLVKINGHSRWLYAAVVVILSSAAAGLVQADPSTAGNAGTTYTVKTVRTLGSTWVAASPKGMMTGHLSPGDRLVETNDILRDGGVKGVFIGTVLVVSPRTVAANRAVGMIRAIYRFADGDLYVDGVVAFSTGGGSGVIVGGTGAYLGARGTLKSNGPIDTLQLLP
jgi:hypothetical protein